MRSNLINSALVLMSVGLFVSSLPAADKSGEAIYKTQCARCHGASGEGTKDVPQPLVGEKSIAQLAGLIGRTMPEDEPEACEGEEAKRVAEYVHDTFYSADARARRNPPRIELSRLTIRQYRNAVADVLGAFRSGAKFDDERGLRAEYFNGRNIGNSRLIERTDPEVRFDFGTEGPPTEEGKEKFHRSQFTIRWQGSVLAPESGEYEFVVRTEHAVQLWVNDTRQPLIDAMVKSGDDTEYRGSISLLAGRYYPLRLEFSKGKQFDNDKKKNDAPPTPATISLLWKRPRGEVELIPSRCLTPARAAEVAVIATPFPPDDRSYGWERGTSVSKEWDAATTNAALDVAGYVSARLPELAGIPGGSGGGRGRGRDREPSPMPTGDNSAKLRAFCAKFVERAFRRPLSDAEKQLFIERQFDAAGDAELAVKRVVLLTLKSPRFLYPDIGDTPEPYAVATRLALTLWDSLPDQPLLDAAAANKLATREEIAAQAERMLADPRAKVKAREFLLTWLKVDQFPELQKDTKRFPEFDAALAADLRTSLELFLDDVVASDTADFRQLLLADETFLNGRLAKFYKADLPADAPFSKVKLDPERRAGVLTHPYLLSVLAYPAESSPIHRGVFIGRGLLGISLRPPPDAFTPLAAEAHPNLTTRERVSLQTTPAACASCHRVMNPLGFALEGFDAVGLLRDKENDKPIDVSGLYETRTGETAKFAGPKELAAFLADSEEVHAAFVQQMFHHLVKQPVRAFGLQKPLELRQSFAENKLNIRKLMVEIAIIASQPRPRP